VAGRAAAAMPCFTDDPVRVLQDENEHGESLPSRRVRANSARHRVATAAACGLTAARSKMGLAIGGR
jgi:hypothetical protein